jgi:SP family xylose:H+ symportor-like MFS transporter
MTMRRLTGVSAPIVLAALGASLGGLLFGYDTAVISGTATALQAQFHLSDSALGLTVAIALIGTVIGALGAGLPADRLGRKKMLMLIAGIYVLSSLGAGLSTQWPQLLASRLLGGLAIGAASVVTPIYIAEVSPPRYRGRLVALNQLNIVVGILLAYLFNYLIASVVPEPFAWRWMLGIVAFPSLAFLSVTFLLPESPRWLVQNGQPEAALAVVNRLGIEDPQKHIQHIHKSIIEQDDRAADKLFQAQYFSPITFAIGLATFNQLSGINALMYYAPYIFRIAGASHDLALLQAVAVGLTNCLFTILAFFFIDRFGRKPLLYAGSIGMAAAPLTVAFQLSHARPDGTLVLLVPHRDELQGPPPAYLKRSSHASSRLTSAPCETGNRD